MKNITGVRQARDSATDRTTCGSHQEYVRKLFSPRFSKEYATAVLLNQLLLTMNQIENERDEERESFYSQMFAI